MWNWKIEKGEIVKKERRSLRQCPVFCLTSEKLFHVGQSSWCRLSLPVTILRPGIRCLCHINFIWPGRWTVFDVLCVDVFVCYLYLIQLTAWTDTIKIRVSDQSDAMLYFPRDKSGEVFTFHPCTTVTARWDGSSPIHCNDRQLTLTIMPLFPVLTTLWRDTERAREMEIWESREVGKMMEADWHLVKEKRLFEL